MKQITEKVKSRIIQIEPLIGENETENFIFQFKRLSFAIHFRKSKQPELAQKRLEQIIIELNTDLSPLNVFWGKMILEIRTKSGYDKGYAVKKFVEHYHLESAIFFGDDVTDVDGMRAIKELNNSNTTHFKGYTIGVLSKDSPQVVIDNSDFCVQGVIGMESFLQWLDHTIIKIINE